MQSHRILSGLTIFLMVVLVAVGYFLVAQPQLAAASTAGAQLDGVKSQIAASQAAVIDLKAEKEKLPELTAQLAALRLSIPSTVDSSAYINGLTSVASAAGVTITGISVADAQAYASPVAPVTTPTAASGSTPSPSPSPSDAPAIVAPATTSWVPTTDPLITGSNFITIPVKVKTTGGTANTLAFIKGLQTGSRLFLVSGFSTAQSADNTNSVNAEISGYIYVIVDPTVPTTTTTSDGTSTATPTPTPSPSGTATPTPTQSPTPTKKP